MDERTTLQDDEILTTEKLDESRAEVADTDTDDMDTADSGDDSDSESDADADDA